MKSFRERTESVSCTTDGVRETLYTCPTNCRSRVMIIYGTDAGGGVDVTLEWYRSSLSTRFYIVKDLSLTLSQSFEFSEKYLVLEPGDRIEVTADGTTPIVDAICTVEEIFIPVGGSNV